MADWSAYRQRLQEMRENVCARLERSGEYGLDDPMVDQLGELSVYDNHPADVASELFEREKDWGLRDRDHIQLQEIDRALSAIDNGTYGTCETCQKPIPEERLLAYPATTLCVDCKRQDEALHPDRSHPIEERFLQPGYARTDTDETSSVAFDGEDAWQAVARFNERPEFADAYEDILMDDNEGVVDDMDIISNEDYRRQLP
jgi:DnaK suppressor protein